MFCTQPSEREFDHCFLHIFPIRRHKTAAVKTIHSRAYFLFRFCGAVKPNPEARNIDLFLMRRLIYYIPFRDWRAKGLVLIQPADSSVQIHSSTGDREFHLHIRNHSHTHTLLTHSGRVFRSILGISISKKMARGVRNRSAWLVDSSTTTPCDPKEMETERGDLYYNNMGPLWLCVCFMQSEWHVWKIRTTSNTPQYNNCFPRRRRACRAGKVLQGH